MDAFDSDVLIYAATHPDTIGAPVKALFDAVPRGPVGMGSALLLPEVLSKPTRLGRDDEVDDLRALLARLTLCSTTQRVATQAAALGAVYNLRAADAVHLATAIDSRADRFITNNRKDFPSSIEEIEIAWLDSLS